MPTFVYSPGIRVRIDTIKKGIVDVSEDLVEGRMTRRQGAPSTFLFALQNPQRKYDGVFTPMDRIVVEMKRVRWVRVYAGYLNSVPLFSVWPRVINLTSTCTLKRLQNWMWDPATAEAQALLLQGLTVAETQQTDGGVKKKVIDLLTKVPKWPKEAIHISQIPANWFNFAKPIAEEIIEQIEVTNYYGNLGGGATLNGDNPINQGLTSIPGIGPGTGTLPQTSGKISFFGVGADAPNGMALTGERPTQPGIDPWFCAMRWPYQSYRNGDIRPVPGVKVAEAIQWWKNRKILIVCPRTQKGVVVRAADWGPGGVPSANQRVIDVSLKAMQALGANTDDQVQIAFAPAGVQTGPFAPLSTTAKGVAGDPSLPTLGPGGWGNPGQDSNMTTFQLSNGKSLTTHKRASGAFQGFVNELLSRGYPMEIIGGYAARKISGSSRWSNHAFGAAIDIDWFEYGNGFDRGTTCKLLKYFSFAEIVAMARKYGLGWGGEWDGRKDWMHFEVIGSPSAARYDGSPVDLGVANGNSPSTTGGDTGVVDPTDILFKAFYNVTPDVGDLVPGMLFAGPRALINDTPLLPYIANLLNASMRTFSSAPNGDFIAWFPDYFGIWGTAARMNVRSIELLDFTVDWSDDYMVTHQFVVGGLQNTFNLATGEFIMDNGEMALPQMVMTKGIASVDFPSIMKALFGIDPSEADTYAFRDFVLRRFGAKPAVEQSAITADSLVGGESEFFLALFLFMQNWANQFSANIPLTFMPELYPGMLLTLPEFAFQAYVQEVEHNFRFGKGGGFTTTAKISAPARTEKGASSVFGLLPIGNPRDLTPEETTYSISPPENPRQADNIFPGAGD